MDHQTYWQEGEPRIIASGRWEQDEHGDTSYIPDHIRPLDGAARRSRRGPCQR